MSRGSRGASAAALLALLAASAPPPAGAAGDDPPRPRRVLVIGIDGADPRLVEQYRAKGALPNIDALAKRGSYSRLATTNPAQSPVSWAGFSTGSNPGKTGIFDFLRRDPAAPGNIQLSLARRDMAEGPLSPSQRSAAPWALGLGAGLLLFGLVVLLLRLLRVAPRARRWAALAAGAAGAGAGGWFAARVVSWVPAEVPVAISYREGKPVWSVLGEAGVPSRAILAPVAFPADRAPNLRLLSGLGTPDVQGTFGVYAVFTDDPKSPVITETAGLVDYLAFDGPGVARSRVYGPENVLLDDAERLRIREASRLAQLLFEHGTGVPSAKRGEERVAAHARRAVQASCVLEVRRDRAGRAATVRVGAGGPRPVLDLPLPEPAAGAPPAPAAPLPDPADSSVRWGEPVLLPEGEWSGFVEFDFRMSPLAKVRGVGRFFLESAGGPGRPFRLLLAPVGFDPRDLPPNVEISSPRDYAPALAAETGLFDTVGWACLTNPVKDDQMPDEAFVAHVKTLLDQRRRLLLNEVAKPDWRFLYVLFSEVDRVQHALWRHIDPESPRHDPAQAARFAGAIEEAYVATDRVIGEALAKVGEDTAVIVLSDHGFAPFRRGVNLNTWLVENGFLFARPEADAALGGERNLAQLFQGKDFFAKVDWTRTKAYALGLGQIYVNLKGREREGCVEPRDYDAVCARIREGLKALRDGDRPVVREVYRGKDIFHGPATEGTAPDLVLGFEWGYRVSWQTCLGGGGEAVIEDNRQRWSGDHCSVDPSLVPGILVSTVPLEAGGASVIDVAPTVLDLFGVRPPPEWDGRTLLGGK